MLPAAIDNLESTSWTHHTGFQTMVTAPRAGKYTWLISVKWFSMLTAGQHTSYLRPAVSIVTLYCLKKNLTKYYTFSNLVKIICNIYHSTAYIWSLKGMPNGHRATRAWNQHNLVRKCSPRELVRGISTRVKFTPKDKIHSGISL